MTDPEISSRQDVYCTQCRWLRPPRIHRKDDDHQAFRAYIDDVVSRAMDHAGGMHHEVRALLRTFHDDRTEATLFRCLVDPVTGRTHGRQSYEITGPTPAEQRRDPRTLRRLGGHFASGPAIGAAS